MPVSAFILSLISPAQDRNSCQQAQRAEDDQGHTYPDVLATGCHMSVPGAGSRQGRLHLRRAAGAGEQSPRKNATGQR